MEQAINLLIVMISYLHVAIYYLFNFFTSCVFDKEIDAILYMQTYFNLQVIVTIIKHLLKN